MSDFTWLCESHGMSAGDPEAIDKLIVIFGGDDSPPKCSACGRFISDMAWPPRQCAKGRGCMK